MFEFIQVGVTWKCSMCLTLILCLLMSLFLNSVYIPRKLQHINIVPASSSKLTVVHHAIRPKYARIKRRCLTLHTCLRQLAWGDYLVIVGILLPGMI